MCENSSGKKFFIVLVGALNVGVMQVSFESAIKTNASATSPSIYEYKDLYLNKGDDFGCFEMGSTIVILAQKDMLELKDLEGRDVKYGETIARNV